MPNIEIKGVDKFKEVFEINLVKRAQAMTRFMVRNIVEKIYDEVKRAIPETENWLKEYKKDLMVYEIRKKDLDKDEMGFVIGARISGDWSMVDADTMIVEFIPKDGSEDYEIGEVLQEYSPFAIDMVPNLPVYGATTKVKRVRSDEISAIREQNKRQRAALVGALSAEGVKPRDGQAKIEGTIYFDMVFMVLRMEQRWGDIKKPHWRPALRNISADISELYRDAKLKKIVEGMFEPGSVEWKKDAKDKYPPMRLADLEKIREFHEKINPL
jgi:hypothetical protein